MSSSAFLDNEMKGTCLRQWKPKTFVMAFQWDVWSEIRMDIELLKLLKEKNHLKNWCSLQLKKFSLKWWITTSHILVTCKASRNINAHYVLGLMFVIPAWPVNTAPRSPEVDAVIYLIH